MFDELIESQHLGISKIYNGRFVMVESFALDVGGYPIVELI
jgi:hypothetical protein